MEEEADGFFSAGRRLVNGIPHSDSLGPASRCMLEKEIEQELAEMNRQDLQRHLHRIIPRTQETRPRRPGLVLSSGRKAEAEADSIFGDDRRRSRVEVIVQAGADDVAPEACRSAGSDDGEGFAFEIEAPQRAETKGCAAEIVIEIFDLQAPIGREQPFAAASGRPAGARI